MSEQPSGPQFKRPLQRHRLVPAREVRPPDANTELPTGNTEGRATLPPLALEALKRLEGRATRSIQEAQPSLDVLPTTLVALGTPEETQESLGLMQSILRVLPSQVASGVESSVEQVDWMFSRLLNAPGTPGLIEQVLVALGQPSSQPADDQPPANMAPLMQALRRLHRDLVTLQSGWDDALELALPPPEASPSAPILPGAADTPAAPKTPTPLPAGSLVAQPEAGAKTRLALPRAPVLARMPRRLALIAVLLLLALGGGSILALRGLQGQAASPNTAQVIARLPTPRSPTNTSQPLPTTTATQAPRPSPTSHPPATPTPRATSTSTPTPLPGPACNSGAPLCVSPAFLVVPCAGQQGVSLQLSTNDSHQEDWSATSSNDSHGTPLVTITPASGKLRQGQTITLTVAANTQDEERLGAITITSTSGAQLMVGIFVCN